MPLPDDVFVDVAAILLISALAGAVALLLRQPLIVAFVAVGVIVGPGVTGLVQPGEELALLAELGIALLLFTVGLKLDVHVVRRLGPVALLVALVQMTTSAAGAFAIALALGLTAVEAAYVGIATAFSSTIIVVKVLSDRREIDELHGRIAVGVLIVQDLVVIVALIAVAATGSATESLLEELGLVALKGAAFGIVLAALTRWAIPRLLHRIAALPDLLLLFSIAWAVAVGAAGEVLDLGLEVGAFVAGVTLAATPYREAIASRLVAVRDFLLLFFFIDLGSRMDVADAADQLALALALALFVLVVKPLSVMGTLGALHYRNRVSLQTGLALAQISEFSLIFAALGLSVEHIGQDTVTLLTVVALVTIVVSTYLIQGSEWIYGRVRPALGAFEREAPREDERESRQPPDVLVLGLGRYGGRVVEGLAERGLRVVGVDFDPVALREAERRGVEVVYGDAEDPELPAHLALPRDGWVISTIRRVDANLALLHALKHHRYDGRVAVAAHREEDAKRLERAGADRVLFPYGAAAADAVELLANGA